VRGITDRPNICGALTFHTFSGVHLRPPSRHPDDELLPEDLWTYQEFGKKGEELTGYPAISNYHEFRYHPKEVITGVFDDWVFEHRGAFAWTTEIWSPQRQAGITDYKYIEWFRSHPFEDDLKLLKWSDEKLGGKGHIEWYDFEHPQLGKIQLGGWDSLYAFRNPPPEFLEKEIAPHSNWIIWQALASPCLEHRDLQVIPNGSTYLIRWAVQNTGFLATNVTAAAGKKNLVRGVIGELSRNGELSSTAGTAIPSWLVAGAQRQQGPQLNGWVHVPSSGFGWQSNTSEDVHVFEWVVSQPGTYELISKHDRAGVVRKSLTI